MVYNLIYLWQTSILCSPQNDFLHLVQQFFVILRFADGQKAHIFLFFGVAVCSESSSTDVLTELFIMSVTDSRKLIWSVGLFSLGACGAHPA